MKYLLLRIIVLFFLSLMVGLIFGRLFLIHAQGLGNCTTGWTIKEEVTESLVSDVNGGHWTKAVIKAGSQNQGDACFTFTENGDNGCYAVFGLGTDTAHASKIGDGPGCKDISHVEWFLSNPSPTPTPSVGPVPSPEVSPSIVPSSEPSASPEASIEPSTSPVPLVTPSPTSSESPQPTPSPEVSPTLSPSAVPTPTPVTVEKHDSVEVQVQKMIQEVKKTDPQILGVASFK